MVLINVIYMLREVYSLVVYHLTGPYTVLKGDMHMCMQIACITILVIVIDKKLILKVANISRLFSKVQVNLPHRQKYVLYAWSISFDALQPLPSTTILVLGIKWNGHSLQCVTTSDPKDNGPLSNFHYHFGLWPSNKGIWCFGFSNKECIES